MLDSLGSTLSSQTIDSFFLRYGKRPAEDELTIPEAVMCLENELCRPRSERKRLNTEDSFADSGSFTPGDDADGRGPGKFFLEGLDFCGPSLSVMLADESPMENASYMHPGAPEQYSTEPSERPLVHVAEPLSTSSTASSILPSRKFSYASSDSEDVPSGRSMFGSTINEEHNFERVINIKTCPLCHRPRLNSKAEVDIVTHLAICASQDWAKVNRIVVGNFVTPSQAQRKWYTKVITKVSNGNYKLGAVCEFSRLIFAWTRVSLTNMLLLELCEYHCAESSDGTVGGRKDAGVCPTGYSTAVQGLSAVCRLTCDRG